MAQWLAHSTSTEHRPAQRTSSGRGFDPRLGLIFCIFLILLLLLALSPLLSLRSSFSATARGRRVGRYTGLRERVKRARVKTALQAAASLPTAIAISPVRLRQLGPRSRVATERLPPRAPVSPSNNRVEVNRLPKSYARNCGELRTTFEVCTVIINCIDHCGLEA